MVNAISIALSGLHAASKQLNASASNIANAHSGGSVEEGGQKSYTPLIVTQTAQTDTQGNPLGVRSDYAPKSPAHIPSYDPDSPYANAQGIIALPNVSYEEEAVNIIFAKLAYKAGIATIKTEKELMDELLKAFDSEA
jgi:flagellar basal-body rod protein FlgC